MNNRSLHWVRNILFLFTALLCFATIPATHAVTLSSTVDRQQIGEDETLNLTISVDDSNVSGSPDLAGLDSNFQIMRSNSSSNTTFINGKVSSQKEWHYILLPRHTGKLLIPSFKLDKLFSDAIEIDVTANSANANGNNDEATTAQHSDLFLEQKLDKSEAYVQERITLTLRIYTAIQIARPQIPDPVLPDVMVEKLGQAEYQSKQNGRDFYVLEYKYGLFANKSGKLTLPKQRYEISQIISNGSRAPFNFPGFDTPDTQSRFLSSPELTLNIKPQPDNLPSDYWLASEDVQISDNWPEQQTAEVGTPLTHSIVIKALGNLAAHIPPLPAMNITGLKSYAENPELTNTQVNDNFLAIRKENIAIVPVQPGAYTLPAITIHWWDTKNKQFKTSTLPERTLMVHGNAAASTTAPSPTPPASSSAPIVNPTNDAGSISPPAGNANAAPAPFYLNLYLWIAIAGVLLTLWIVTIVLLLRKKSSALSSNASDDARPSSSLKEALKQLKSACLKHDAKQARAALIHWAQQQWPEANILTVADVKNRINQPAFTTLADDLDSCLYRENAVWNGKLLADFMQTTKFYGTAAKPEVKLPGLYSQT
jgi:hypothetical protein